MPKPPACKTQNSLSPLNSNSSGYARAATSDNTRMAYRSDIRHFMHWGGVLPTTPDVVVRYLERHAQLLHPNTLKRRITAIKNWHTYQGFPDPTDYVLIRKTLSGIGRIHLKATKKAPALSLEQLTRLSAFIRGRNSLADQRDLALLQIGFFGAFRRSELVAIQWEHIKFVPQGVEIYIPTSKTDQEGEGAVCAIPYGQLECCPVVSLKQWQERTKRVSGPVFVAISKSGYLSANSLSPASVGKVLKKHAQACSLPNATDFSAHSLRRGFATSASQKGAGLIAIMRHGRWKAEKTVLGYVDEGQRFQNNAAGMLLQGERCS